MTQHQREVPVQRLEIPDYRATPASAPKPGATTIHARNEPWCASAAATSASTLRSIVQATAEATGRAYRSLSSKARYGWIIGAVIAALVLLFFSTATPAGQALDSTMPACQVPLRCDDLTAPSGTVAPYSIPTSPASASDTLHTALAPLLGAIVGLVMCLLAMRHFLEIEHAWGVLKAMKSSNRPSSAAISEYDDLCGWLPPEELLKQTAYLNPRIGFVKDNLGSLVSRVGPRSENQDYGLIFRLGEGRRVRTILVSADGLGGHRGGRPASFVAARAVLESAARHADLDTVSLMWALLHDAEQGVSCFARQHFGPSECLTTCLVAIADAKYYHAAWLGDGGIRIRRDNGIWIDLMTPQRAVGESNVVTGLLGAERVNEWKYAVERRLPGDWLMVGSDGAMDDIHDGEAFFEQPIKQMKAGLSFHRALDDWWAWVDGANPLCFRDNITAVTLLTPPRRSPASSQSHRRNAWTWAPQTQPATSL